ncbi:MAG: threonylcarbamoyl-AMP synthase [Acidobacteria bacterium]|nr:threonylcarbamoyl-AMP synthase [Acidobacteriota bacterium]MBU4405071.1 threonylcarbamoyl-AMP synthase [Acidobacteriota bacterium]MCG2811679.1 threonylcarbamoyl-AMP synthase [Candidatus Aminicenantes bacterium]
MAVEIQKIDLNHPHKRLLQHAVNILKDGGLIVYPTDTIYGLGADLFNKGAIERIFKLKKTSRRKLLSFICPDLAAVADWAYVPTSAYRVLRRVTPGKYTFVLRAGKLVPKILLQKRPTVGVRIPDSAVALGLVRELGRPLLSTSVPQGEVDYYTDPLVIAETFRHDIDLILDAGILANLPSTIVDLSGSAPAIIRFGAGASEPFGL